MSLNYPTIKRYAEIDANRASKEIIEALKQGDLPPAEVSIKRIFETFVPGGAEMLNDLVVHGQQLTREAADAVTSGAFANITGQLVFSAILEGYRNPDYLWPSLARNIPTTLNGEKIAGITALGDNAEQILEGDPYPYVGIGEEWIETPETRKWGLIVPITKEAVFFDRTGILVERAQAVGDALSIRKEKEVLDVATGQNDIYSYRGTNGISVYGDSSGSHDWDNLAASNGLVDWTDIETAELLFDGMTDPNTGEPMIIQPKVLLVPTALKHTARRIVNATEVQTVDNQTNAATIRFTGPNPGAGYNILTNAWVKDRTSSATTWFFGDFMKAFAWMENWSIRVERQTDDKDTFERDILVKFKASERGRCAVIEPRAVVKSTA